VLRRVLVVACQAGYREGHRAGLQEARRVVWHLVLPVEKGRQVLVARRRVWEEAFLVRRQEGHEVGHEVLLGRSSVGVSLHPFRAF
jgi:hypothetical protein